MSLKKLPLKHIYDSIRDDLYGEFFSKVLSNSQQCMRIGGQFTSRNFAACAEGMQNFIMNDGIMKLVLTPNFSKEDIDAINSGLKNDDDLILKNWIREYDQVTEKFEKQHAKALAWMLKNKFLEIKILIGTDSSGKRIRPNELKIPLLDKKIGIFKGKEYDEFITFEGNLDYDNVTHGEYHRINVYRYWDESEKKFCDSHYEEFKKFWDGEEFEIIQDYKFKTISLPNAIKENLIQIAPKSKSEINLARPFSLRKHQKLAIKKWKENRFRGIFEMATGTGKTMAAIGCIKELKNSHEKFITIIACPSDPLAVQWKDEMEKWGYKTINTQRNPKWKLELSDYIKLFENNKIDNLNIITSYITLANPKLHLLLMKSNLAKLFIADEVHHAGAPEHRKGLLANYEFRLGLTATLERYFDDEGTKIITDYFDNVVFEYTMAEAIKDGWLVNYYYNIREVDLTSEEYVEYRKYSRIMAANYKKMNKDPICYDIFMRAAEKRANTVQNAINKLQNLRELINEVPELKYTLIYCNPGQINNAQEILNNKKPIPIFSRKITQKDTPTREQKEEVFNGLLKGNYHAVLAIKILDEGWDCPEVKNCILLASSGNEKQYIQRRGRILRPFNGEYSDGSKKKDATIYDLCVIPEIASDATDEEIKMERGIAEKEIRRLEIMAKTAKNSPEALEKIEELRKRFRV